MMEQLRAHGFDPGPMQRPVATGFVAGGLCVPIAIAIFARSGALQSPAMVALAAFVLVLEGALYGRVFRRAANDKRGGWMFGMASGFAAWTVVIELVRAAHANLYGVAAMGLFGGFVLHGAVVGLVFPWVHATVRRGARVRPVAAQRMRHL